MNRGGSRVTVLWFPDWPVYAIGRAKGWDVFAPASIVKEHRVVACNAAARAAGVRRGMKQRHALATCPALNLAEDDPAQQAAVHEDVLLALESVAADVETLRPGLLALPTGSLTRYYGDEHAAVELLLDAAARMHADCLAGTADDVVTAIWAAREGKNIPAGDTAAFVQRLPVRALVSDVALNGPRELVSLLEQLGVRTLKDFALLPRADVTARFGAPAGYWHRIANGETVRDIAPERGVTPIVVRQDMDEPLVRAETAAFVARQAAAKLHAELFAAGDACLRLAVRAYLMPPPGYTGPTTIERVWRCREPLTEEETAQRVRWQLDGWLTRMAGASDAGASADGWCADEAGVTALELVPLDVVPAGKIDMPLWGGVDEGIRAARAAAGRAQALIGIEQVRRPIHKGGRGVGGRVVTVAYGEQTPESITAQKTTRWVGELIHPLPPLIGAPAHPAARIRLLDAHGRDIHVTGRGVLSGIPDQLLRGNTSVNLTGWAGPWPVDEHWWAKGKRYARVQVSTDEPGAYLLVAKDAAWRIEATY